MMVHMSTLNACFAFFTAVAQEEQGRARVVHGKWRKAGETSILELIKRELHKIYHHYYCVNKCMLCKLDMLCKAIGMLYEIAAL